MKYIMILIMCFPALVLLYGASGEFYNGSIVIEFPNSLNPTVEDGVVITGYAAGTSHNHLVAILGSSRLGACHQPNNSFVRRPDLFS